MVNHTTAGSESDIVSLLQRVLAGQEKIIAEQERLKQSQDTILSTQNRMQELPTEMSIVNLGNSISASAVHESNSTYFALSAIWNGLKAVWEAQSGRGLLSSKPSEAAQKAWKQAEAEHSFSAEKWKECLAASKRA